MLNANNEVDLTAVSVHDLQQLIREKEKLDEPQKQKGGPNTGSIPQPRTTTNGSESRKQQRGSKSKKQKPKNQQHGSATGNSSLMGVHNNTSLKTRNFVSKNSRKPDSSEESVVHSKCNNKRACPNSIEKPKNTALAQKRDLPFILPDESCLDTNFGN